MDALKISAIILTAILVAIIAAVVVKAKKRS